MGANSRPETKKDDNKYNEFFSLPVNIKAILMNYCSFLTIIFPQVLLRVVQASVLDLNRIQLQYMHFYINQKVLNHLTLYKK